MTETAVAVYEPINEEVLEQMSEDAEGMELYVKATPEGFAYNDTVVSEIIGRLIEIRPCWVLWKDKKPERVFDKEKPSDDFERRCEVKVLSRDGFVINLSLTATGYKNLCAYHKSLKARGVDINDAITCLKTKEVNGAFGVFAMVVFTLISDVPF